MGTFIKKIKTLSNYINIKKTHKFNNTIFLEITKANIL